jgi:hypothetical protein
MVASWLSDPTPERGGRAKRCYGLEGLGEQVLQESAVTAKRIWDGIAEVWGKDWAAAVGQTLGKGSELMKPCRPHGVKKCWEICSSATALRGNTPGKQSVSLSV